MVTVSIAKFFMRLAERVPTDPTLEIGESSEVFSHELLTEATPEARRQRMLESSEAKYKSELAYPWDNYFGMNLERFLRGKSVLDLGCFNGGRGVAWCERYQLKKLTGIDVKEEFIEAARLFAATKNVNAEFTVAIGEKLPFEDETFDGVLSFDVFEHVQSVEKTLGECMRVLIPGGRLFVVFPSFFHPLEHHLSLATATPCIHYFFSSNTLINAYCDIIDERGDSAYWYRRETRELRPWERGNTINGTTAAAFRRLARRQGWDIVFQSRKPVGTIGRNVSRKLLFKTVGAILAPFAFVPGLEEFVLHRNTFILEKRRK